MDYCDELSWMNSDSKLRFPTSFVLFSGEKVPESKARKAKLHKQSSERGADFLQSCSPFISEPCEGRGGRPGLPVLTVPTVSVDVKPVLNWANICSPEHTSDTSTNYDSFQLLVRRIMFGQSKTLLHSHRPELAADAQQTA